MVKSHADTQRDKHFAGLGLEETIVLALEQMLEKNQLDAVFEVVGKQRSRRHNVLVVPAPLLPGATIQMELRPDFGIRHRASGQFGAFGGAKRSFRERSVQDFIIAQRIKEVHPNAFWFECTVAERDDSTHEQIIQNLKRLSAVYGSVWDALCSTSAPDSMMAMKRKLTAHLKVWCPTPEKSELRGTLFGHVIRGDSP